MHKFDRSIYAVGCHQQSTTRCCYCMANKCYNKCSLFH